MATKTKTKLVTIHEAKTNLSRLIAEACKGEEIIIARGSEPVARLIAIKPNGKEQDKGPRKPGLFKGKFTVGPEFFEPLPDDELEAWGL